MIVLLSDGENNERPDPIAMAQEAADRGIRIVTIGIGSAAGADLDLDGFKVHTQLDEATLTKIAEMTGGSYHAADDPDGVEAIYQDLQPKLVVRTEPLEVTSLFAALGLGLLVDRRRAVARVVGEAAVTFLWIGLLALVLLVPILVAVYLWSQRRRRPVAARYSSLSLIRAARPGASRLRRHLPFTLFAAGVAALVIALGRPVVVLSVPANQATIILAMDVSGSMCSTDIDPTRLEAAEDAAVAFVTSQSSGSEIGLVAFSGLAAVIQPPTNDQQALVDAIRSLTTGRRTAIGSGILASIDAIAEVDPNVARAILPGRPGTPARSCRRGRVRPRRRRAPHRRREQRRHPAAGRGPAGGRSWGARVHDRVRDGGRAAELDAICRQQFIGREPAGAGGFGFGGGGFGGGGGGGFRRGIDEDTLKAVANLTGGEYYPAESANELEQVFRDLPTTTITKAEPVEVSAGFVGLGAVLAAMALLLGRAWRPLP